MTTYKTEPASLQNFDETLYLLANPDVALAVATGEMRSGREHFEIFGRQEGRRIVKALEVPFAFYESRAPSAENALDLFKGQWTSAIPGQGYGTTQLFEDPRLDWFVGHLGDLRGKRILELGPLEGGHTYTLSRLGALVTAVESNAGAYLKCLIIKEIFDLRARFLLGDFVQFLSNTSERFDAVIASGVLYHMEQPIALLESLMRVSNNVFIWTHYFDEQVIRSRADIQHKFAHQPVKASFKDLEVDLWQQSYLDALDWSGFCGGPAQNSMWLTKDGLLGILKAGNFEVTIGSDSPDHANGPALLLFAHRSG
jgi:hypothetical protein